MWQQPSIAPVPGTRKFPPEPEGLRSDRASSVHAGMRAAAKYEQALAKRLVGGLQAIPTIRIHGITNPDEFDGRVPTFIFDVEGHHPRAVAEALSESNIFVWDGDYYAQEVIDTLGYRDRGGLVRVGLAHYNTADEIDRLLQVLSDLP